VGTNIVSRHCQCSNDFKKTVQLANEAVLYSCKGLCKYIKLDGIKYSYPHPK